MTEHKKETTALSPSVDADGGQSNHNKTNTIIPDTAGKCNMSEKEMMETMRQMQRMHSPNYLHTLTLNELYESTYETKPAIIDSLLYPGTYLFAGAPKVGKSFFMAQLAYHVSTGLPFWGVSVRQGTVLYLALEDDFARLQRRLAKMFDVDGTDNLRFAIGAKQVGAGLDEQLQEFLRQYPDTRLVIIDTLQKVRESGGESYSYSNDYELVGKLKRLVDDHNLCLLLVHHTRKQKAGDNFEMISGTTGLSGAADGAFVMQKENRTDATATLEVCGRDQQDQKFHLSRDLKRLSWMLERAETEQFVELPEPILDKISALLTKEQPSWEGTATELAELLGLDMKPNKVTMKLNVNQNRLLTEHGICYQNTRSFSGRKISLHREMDGA